MESEIRDVSQILLEVARTLVDRPDELTMKAFPDNDLVTLRIFVHPSDVGKLIGTHGRTARALRVLVNAYSARLNSRLALDICSQEEANLTS